jgi:hypothetical protein
MIDAGGTGDFSTTTTRGKPMSEATPVIRAASLVSAFEQGQAAFRAHTPISMNPYGTGLSIEQRHHWDAGWVTACVSTSRQYGVHYPHDDNTPD